MKYLQLVLDVLQLQEPFRDVPQAVLCRSEQFYMRKSKTVDDNPPDDTLSDPILCVPGQLSSVRWKFDHLRVRQKEVGAAAKVSAKWDIMYPTLTAHPWVINQAWTELTGENEAIESLFFKGPQAIPLLIGFQVTEDHTSCHWSSNEISEEQSSTLQLAWPQSTSITVRSRAVIRLQ